MAEQGYAKEVVVAGERFCAPAVHFESCNPASLRDLIERTDRAPKLEAHGNLFLPSGELVSRAAVVIVQGLGGQKPERELTYGHKLAKAGAVALSLDSFGARSLADVDDKWKALQVATWSIVADTFSALRYLARHPAVNPRAISVIGFSWGGMATLLAAYEQIRAIYLGDADLRFAGHVSYYGCSIPRLEDPRTTGSPVLVLVGAHDENVSVERTRLICDDLRRGGSAVELDVLNGFHQWDGKDEERRHVFGALADVCITITRNNEVREERWDTEIEGAVSQALVILRDLRWGGYEIQRHEDLHRKTDRRLFAFLADVARRNGAVPLDVDAVPLGEIGEPCPEG
jgi:dienelactone hydrolase